MDGFVVANGLFVVELGHDRRDNDGIAGHNRSRFICGVNVTKLSLIHIIH